jgi:thiamine pyrophosphate-dependent acetolactate synthase large subunit-like protein
VAEITSEVLIKRLAEWGVDTIFGLPGDGINGIMEAAPSEEESQAPGDLSGQDA